MIWVIVVGIVSKNRNTRVTLAGLRVVSAYIRRPLQVEIFNVTPQVYRICLMLQVKIRFWLRLPEKGNRMLNIQNNKPTAYKLPNALREAMLKMDNKHGLVVLEGLYLLAFKADKWLKFDEVYRVCRDNFGMSYQLVYKGLRNGLIFQRRKAEGIAGRRGARPYLFRIPHPDELIAEFKMEQKHSPHDALKKVDLKSVSAYRKALHRQLFIRKWLDNQAKGFMMSRKLMAERLGVSVRTIRTYDKQLGFSNEPNYKEIPITTNNWFKLPRFKDKFDATGKRLPSKVWLKILNVDDETHQNMPCVRYLAYKALNEGKHVYKVERLINTYYPYQKPDLSQLDSWDALAHYYAEKDARNQAGFYEHQNGGWCYQRE